MIKRICEVNIIDAWGPSAISQDSILRLNLVKSPQANKPKLNYSKFGLGSLVVVESVKDKTSSIVSFAGRVALIGDDMEQGFEMEASLSICDILPGSVIYQGYGKIHYDSFSTPDLVKNLDRYEELQSMHLGIS